MTGGDVFNAPCQSCENRHPLCWGDCRAYKEFKEKCKAFNAHKTREYAIENYYRTKSRNLLHKEHLNSKKHYK